MTGARHSAARRRIGAFDWFVFAGAGVNLVVAGFLIIHWLIA